MYNHLLAASLSDQYATDSTELRRPGGLTLHWDFALILAVLAFVVPVMGRRRVRALPALPDTTKLDRLSIYASTIAFQWLAAALILWRTIRHGITPAQLGISLGHGYLLIATVCSIELTALVESDRQCSQNQIRFKRISLRDCPAGPEGFSPRRHRTPTFLPWSQP